MIKYDNYATRPLACLALKCKSGNSPLVHIHSNCGAGLGDLALCVYGDARRMLKEDPGRVIPSLATPTALQIKNTPSMSS